MNGKIEATKPGRSRQSDALNGSLNQRRRSNHPDVQSPIANQNSQGCVDSAAERTRDPFAPLARATSAARPQHFALLRFFPIVPRA